VRQWLAQRRWGRQCDRNDPLACGRLKRLRPTSAYFWVQTLEAVVIEGVDHVPHACLVRLADQRYLVDGRLHHRDKQNLRALTQCLPARLPQMRKKLHFALFRWANEQ